MGEMSVLTPTNSQSIKNTRQNTPIEFLEESTSAVEFLSIRNNESVSAIIKKIHIIQQFTTHTWALEKESRTVKSNYEAIGCRKLHRK